MSSTEPIANDPAITRSTFSPSAVRESIESANRRFTSAFRDGDAAAVAACYTADGQLLPANVDAVTGTQAIEGFWRAVMGMGIADVRLDTLEVETDGKREIAVEIGRYALNGADGGTLDNGKYVVVWHLENGSWKLHRDIWTTSRPAPTA